MSRSRLRTPSRGIVIVTSRWRVAWRLLREPRLGTPGNAPRRCQQHSIASRYIPLLIQTQYTFSESLGETQDAPTYDVTKLPGRVDLASEELHFAGARLREERQADGRKRGSEKRYRGVPEVQ